MKKRIWELDVFRGICILGVIAVHFIYDLVELYSIIDWKYPPLFSFIKSWGGVLFVMLSGICATLGSRSVRRGLIVIASGLLITAVTFGMYKFGFDKSIIIYFGVLHCLGTCMVLWALFKKCPTWLLCLLGIAMVAAGLYLRGNSIVDVYWLIPLGFVPKVFPTSDYFPLLPNLGFFLLGAVLGRTVYRKKESLLPMVNVVLNGIFIPRFGYLAAGSTTLASYLLLAALHYILMKRACRIHKVDGEIFPSKLLLAICNLVIGLTFAAMGLYTLGWVRYGVIALEAALVFLFRRRLLALLKHIKKGA